MKSTLFFVSGIFMLQVLVACGGGGGGDNPPPPPPPPPPPKLESARISSIWTTNTGVGWAYQTSHTLADFSDYAQARKNQGLRPWDIDVRNTGNGLRVSSIWVSNGGVGWAYQISYNLTDFTNYANARKNAGMRPWDIEVTYVNGQRRYSSIWTTNEGVSWAYQTALSGGDFADYANDRKNQGLRPWDLEVSTSDVSGSKTYASIWTTNTAGAWSYQTSYESDDFNNYANNRKNLGYRPWDIEVSDINGIRRYSSIWVQNEGVAWAYQTSYESGDFSTYANARKNAGMRPWDLN